MENNYYEKIPNIISCKDLDYLSDMFNWNYSAYKNAYNASNNISDNELKEKCKNIADIFYNNLTNILNIINGGIDNEQQSNM